MLKDSCTSATCKNSAWKLRPANEGLNVNESQMSAASLYTRHHCLLPLIWHSQWKSYSSFIIKFWQFSSHLPQSFPTLRNFRNFPDQSVRSKGDMHGQVMFYIKKKKRMYGYWFHTYIGGKKVQISPSGTGRTPRRAGTLVSNVASEGPRGTFHSTWRS